MPVAHLPAMIYDRCLASRGFSDWLSRNVANCLKLSRTVGKAATLARVARLASCHTRQSQTRQLLDSPEFVVLLAETAASPDN